MTTITIDSTLHGALPVSRKAMGFPVEADRGNAILLLAGEMQPASCAAYQQAGYIHEGVCILACCEEVYTVLEQMHLRWCPWPDRRFTLAILPHSQMSLLADRLAFSRLGSQKEAQ